MAASGPGGDSLSPAPESRLIGFRVGGTGAALPIEIVREVMARAAVVRVPGSHPHVSGVVLHGGVALPVYDLRRFAPLWSSPRQGSGEDASDLGQIIVCDWGEVLFGLLGDRVDLLEESGAAPGATEEAADGLSRRYVKGVLIRNGERIALLDTETLFASLGVPAAEPRGGREAGEDDPARG